MQWDEMDTNQRNNLVGQLIEAKPLTQLYVAWDGNNLFCLPFTINTWTRLCSSLPTSRAMTNAGRSGSQRDMEHEYVSCTLRVRFGKPDDNH